MSKEIYQEIYDTEAWYGNAEMGRSPGMRLMPRYRSFLEGKVVELGCGRGNVVEFLRENGAECEGYDQVSINPNMKVADITKDLDISPDTIICIDVIEHIDDEGLDGLFSNFKKAKKQVFAIHNGPSVHNGMELHINRKPFDEWNKVIEKKGFKIVKMERIHDEQFLYYTETVTG